MKGCPTIQLLFLVLAGCCIQPDVFAQEEVEEEVQEEILPEGVVKESFPLRSSNGRELSFYLRYPSSGEESVEGVLFFCMPGQVEKYLTGGHLQDFVEQRNIAVIAFGQPGGGRWNRTVNSDLLSSAEAAEQDRKMDEISREWASLAKRFCRKNNLPDRDWFIYGACGGAQFAHRVAFRTPELFCAIHVHYGGSYDEPAMKGKSIEWLVTTHADEPSYIAAQHFFRKCREMGFQIILKGYTRRSAPELYEDDFFGGGRGGMQGLSRQFFENSIAKAKGQSVGEERFIGDVVNGSVFPEKEGAWIPRKQAVILEGSALAEAWER